MPKRKSIRLSPEEDSTLRSLYRHFRIPIEQFFQRPAELEEFVELWNAATGRADTADDVVHYMMTRRKDSRRGGWVTFEGKHKRLRNPGQSIFDAGEWAFLEDWLRSHHVSADQLGTDHDLAQVLNREFAATFERSVALNLLVAAIIARRKRGLLTLGPRKDGDAGFRDIEQFG